MKGVKPRSDPRRDPNVPVVLGGRARSHMGGGVRQGSGKHKATSSSASTTSTTRPSAPVGRSPASSDRPGYPDATPPLTVKIDNTPGGATEERHRRGRFGVRRSRGSGAYAPCGRVLQLPLPPDPSVRPFGPQDRPRSSCGRSGASSPTRRRACTRSSPSSAAPVVRLDETWAGPPPCSATAPVAVANLYGRGAMHTRTADRACPPRALFDLWVHDRLRSGTRRPRPGRIPGALAD